MATLKFTYFEIKGIIKKIIAELFSLAICLLHMTIRIYNIYIYIYIYIYTHTLYIYSYTIYIYICVCVCMYTIYYIICILYNKEGRSQWPRGLRRRSAAAHLLRSRVRIPPGAWMFVCCECFVLSGRGLCDELFTRPKESYRL